MTRVSTVAWVSGPSLPTTHSDNESGTRHRPTYPVNQKSMCRRDARRCVRRICADRLVKHGEKIERRASLRGARELSNPIFLRESGTENVLSIEIHFSTSRNYNYSRVRSNVRVMTIQLSNYFHFPVERDTPFTRSRDCFKSRGERRDCKENYFCHCRKQKSVSLKKIYLFEAIW